MCIRIRYTRVRGSFQSNSFFDTCCLVQEVEKGTVQTQDGGRTRSGTCHDVLALLLSSAGIVCKAEPFMFTAQDARFSASSLPTRPRNPSGVQTPRKTFIHKQEAISSRKVGVL